MRMEMKVVFCVLVLLTGSPQAGGQSSALPPVLLSYAGSSSSLDLRIDDPAGSEALGTVHSGTVHSATVHSGTVHSGTVHSGTVHSATVHSGTVHSENSGTVHSEMTTNAVYPTTNMVTADSAVASPSGSRSSSESVQSAAPLLHTSTPDSRAFLASHPFTSFSSQPAHTAAQDTSSTAHASTVQSQSDSLTTVATQPTTTGHHLTSAPGRGPAGPTHQEVPSELNVGDDELKGPHHRSSSPLDPLLAGLLSVFIVTTAVVFVVLFLKFRQRTNHPEFHRLQDLPMDDLMEDTPLSRYTY